MIMQNLHRPPSNIKMIGMVANSQRGSDVHRENISHCHCGTKLRSTGIFKSVINVGLIISPLPQELLKRSKNEQERQHLGYAPKIFGD